MAHQLAFVVFSSAKRSRKKSEREIQLSRGVRSMDRHKTTILFCVCLYIRRQRIKTRLKMMPGNNASRRNLQRCWKVEIWLFGRKQDGNLSDTWQLDSLLFPVYCAGFFFSFYYFTTYHMHGVHYGWGSILVLSRSFYTSNFQEPEFGQAHATAMPCRVPSILPLPSPLDSLVAIYLCKGGKKKSLIKPTTSCYTSV
jgi:hypothetical protein